MNEESGYWEPTYNMLEWNLVSALLVKKIGLQNNSSCRICFVVRNFKQNSSRNYFLSEHLERNMQIILK